MKVSKPVFVFVILSLVLTLCSCGPFGVIPLLGAAAGGGGDGGDGPTGPLPPPNPFLVLHDQTDVSLLDFTNDFTVGVSVTGLALDVTHYMLDETTAGKPAPAAPGWQPLPIPTIHTFTSTGLNTLYLWVKNSADLVNAGVSLAQIEVDLTPPIDPVLTLKDTDTDDPLLTDEQTVNVETAGIDADVVAYIISETHTTAPAELSPYWISTLPATFDLSAGESLKTVYLWVKDHAGNICANPGIHQITYNTAAIADPLYHLEDLTSGSSAYSDSITVKVVPTSIDVDATYYLISETQSTQPLPADPSWTAMPLPATFTLGGTGLRTVYIWLKDDLGEMNPNPAPSQIEVDITAPGTPTLTLLDQSSGDTAHTNDPQVGVTTSGIDADVTHFILSEGIAATPAENDSSWTVLPVWGIFTCTSGDGDKTVNLWLKDHAGNVCVPGIHTIELDTTVNSPTLALQDQDSGDQSWCNDQTVDAVIGSLDSDIVEYIISETIVATPGISAPEWNSIQPVAYTFDTSTEEKKTAYLWVKDDAENIAGTSAAITYDATDPTAIASPAGGNFVNPITVTLTASDDLDPSPAMYYTTDGSSPTTGSTPYTGPISIAADTTLKFIAVDAAGNQSGIYEEFYDITLATTYVATTGDDLTGDGTLGNPYASIEKGLDSATSGTTVLVLNGTYKGTTNRNLDFAGKDILLKSAGGAANCIIDCENSDRGFYFHSGETDAAIVEGFTIQNGNSASGGGIYCLNSSPTITDCTVTGCSATSGGGICCFNSTSRIARCKITANTAASYGGGIYCSGIPGPTIINCAVDNNSVTTGNGGGIFCWDSDPTITNCTVTDSSASNWGGGIYCFDNASPTVITNCLIANNSASRGGGICLDVDSSSEITNCTTAGNSADYGGGIYLFNASTTVNNSVIWGNAAATQANQIHVDGTSTAALNYSCFANGLGDVEGTGTVTPDANCINLDPEFVCPMVGNYRLRHSSTCIDKGDNTAATGADLDGKPRIINGTVDMGAYEFRAVPVSTTIQDAIDVAENGDTVLVADGTHVGPGNKDLDLKGKVITVCSEYGPASCIIDCEFSGRAFSLSSGEGPHSHIDGFTIMNGSSSSGAGIYCTGSSPTIANCTITGNIASSSGGGFCCLNASPAIVNCHITYNSADNGGGFYCSGSSPSIVNCNISDNDTPGGSSNGAGFFCGGDSAPVVTNCTIACNTSGFRSGGIHIQDNPSPTSSPMVLNNTIVWGNSAPTAANQILCAGNGWITLNYCCFADGAGDMSRFGTVTETACLTEDPAVNANYPEFVDATAQDYHLLGTSPCIDKGKASLLPPGITTDLDGRQRVWGANIDIGAYEGGYLIVDQTVGPFITIQSAIDASTDGNVVLVKNGTYKGLSNKDLDFGGRLIHLKSAGGAANCIIDCELSGRGFYFQSGETSAAVVEGVTIQNGDVGVDSGGGIYCHSSSPTITNCTIETNFANNGGGISCINSSSATVTRCIISLNSVTNDGGGIFCNNDSNVAITNCTIVNNSADSYAGGGICCNSASPIINNSLIADNSAWFGGGIRCYDNSNPTITNCTIVNNSVGSEGGGIQSHTNTAPILSNSILWGNTASQGNQIYTWAGSTVTLNYCNYANGGSDIEGDGTVTDPLTSCINLDPQFVGGTDYHLQGISPCIDKGNNGYVTWSEDLDGKPRIVDGNNPPDGTATIDMGAYEYQP